MFIFIIKTLPLKDFGVFFADNHSYIFVYSLHVMITDMGVK